VGKYPGVWELPVYNLPMDESGYPNMCGFDTSIYDWKKSGPDFFNMLKWALDKRLSDGGNRAPLTIGVHTDLYSSKNEDASSKYDSFASLESRRKAIEDFIDYALSKPEVRIVKAKQIFQWMSDPVPL
jgi:hypothetical protein